MCTIGGLGRHIGRQWTDISADSRPINVHLSADASAVGRSIYRSTIGQLSVDSRPINVYISGDALVDCRSIVGRLSAYMSTEATYSTHDPLSGLATCKL